MSELAHRRWPAALAGVASVGLALGVTELLAGAVDDVPSLVTSVGELVIPVVPPTLEDAAIATFGTADKAVLVVGTVLLTLMVGAYAGLAGHRSRSSAVVLFAMASLVGIVAAGQQALSSTLGAVVSTTVGAGVGLFALFALLDRLAATVAFSAGGTAPGTAGAADTGRGAPVPPRRAVDREVPRRRFLVGLGGVATTAALTAAVGRSLLGRGDVRPPDLTLPPPTDPAPPVPDVASFDDIAGLAPIVTPNERFYRIDTALFVPRVDVDEWRLRVVGMVDRELEITFDELVAMPSIEAYVTLACVSNEVGGDLVDTAVWQGVLLADVLAAAGVRDGATQIVGRAVDGWTAGFPTDVIDDGREAMIAYGMNGEPLPAEHGFPARLVVPGLYGYVSATKWLTELELTTLDGFDAYWVPRGWSKQGPIKTQSRIDVPGRGAQVPAGRPMPVAGVAFAPTRGIRSVEIRIDQGDWLVTELSAPLSDDAWVQWRRVVTFEPGSHVIQVRATDGRGVTQTDRIAPPRPDGATGHDAVRIEAVAAG